MKRKSWIYIASWLSLTLSLAGWWLVYGLRQIEKLAQYQKDLPGHIIQQQRMLQWEGLFLFALLIAGGFALFYFSLREGRRADQIKEFFATLTHELKTPLASLRLQAESLQEDLGQNSPHKNLVTRLVRDTIRLELQLENALFLASVHGREQLHIEKLSLKEILENMREIWPEMKILVNPDHYVRADSRALEGIIKNLLQNARTHGRASEIRAVSVEDQNFIRLSIEDNGRGFSGNTLKLGELFYRPTSESGSGVGLYLASHLVRQMNGQMMVQPRLGQNGFQVDLVLERPCS